MIRNESEILNVGMSKPPKLASRPVGGLRGAVSAPAGYRATPRSKKYVSTVEPHLTVTSVVRKPPNYSHPGSVPNYIP